jgi:hypothetical protein
LIFKRYGFRNAENEYQVIKEYFLLKDAAPIGGQSRYAKAEVIKSAVALWDAACLVSRSLCPGNFSLWWVGEENSGFAYANGPPSFFLLFFLKSLFKQIRKLHKQFSFFC